MAKHKWIIRPKKTLTASERQSYWESIHNKSAYSDAFSTTEDVAYREKIIHELDQVGDIRSVLIPGCGSRVFLQKELARKPKIKEICCTDFEGVVQVAENHFRHPKVQYLARNSTALGFKDKWDAIVIVNSILSESDEENRNILLSCYNALRPGGTLIGYFPTIFCAVDVDSIDPSLGVAKYIDLKRNSFYEKRQGAYQIFYTPLRLRYILKEAGFRLDKMEIYFLDSNFFKKQGAEYYGLKDEDAVIYELFIVAIKY